MFLCENSLLHVLAAHAGLEKSLPGRKFPYIIPKVPEPQPQSHGWHLEAATGVEETTGAARLLLWFAVSYDAEQFDRNWLYYEQLLEMLDCVPESDGEIHPIRRVERWVHEAAEAIVAHASGESHNKAL